MRYQTYSNISEFRAWAGGASWQRTVLNSSEEVIDCVDSLLDELFGEDSNATETDVNDCIWFDLPEYMHDMGYIYDTATDSFIATWAWPVTRFARPDIYDTATDSFIATEED